MTNNDDSLHESFGEVEDSGSDEASLADSLSIDSFDFQGLVDGEYKNMDTSAAVSYTHLTLPTILLV